MLRRCLLRLKKWFGTGVSGTKVVSDGGWSCTEERVAIGCWLRKRQPGLITCWNIWIDNSEDCIPALCERKFSLYTGGPSGQIGRLPAPPSRCSGTSHVRTPPPVRHLRTSPPIRHLRTPITLTAGNDLHRSSNAGNLPSRTSNAANEWRRQRATPGMAHAARVIPRARLAGRGMPGRSHAGRAIPGTSDAGNDQRREEATPGEQSRERVTPATSDAGNDTRRREMLGIRGWRNHLYAQRTHTRTRTYSHTP